MAGSLKDMVYFADDGDAYVVRIDESNGELAGFSDYTGQNLRRIPAGMTMRYANCVEPITGAQRRIPIGTNDDPIILGTVNALLLFLVTGNAGALASFVIRSVVGEAYRRPSADDTGLTDGDDT